METDGKLTADGLLNRAEDLIANGDLVAAQSVLDGIEEKSGRKYFVQGKLFESKKWYNEQRKQLKAAVKKEPENEEYKKELAELEEFGKTAEFKKYRREESGRQMGDCCITGCMACGDGCVGGCGAGC